MGLTARTISDKEYLAIEQARRTSFVARFIVLREGKKTKAHRAIEELCWEVTTTAEEVAEILRDCFRQSKSLNGSTERDVKRALEHANRIASNSQGDGQRRGVPIWPLVEEYNKRSSTNFVQALYDYERSNKLLFGDDEAEQPRHGGWRLASDLERDLKRKAVKTGQDIHV